MPVSPLLTGFYETAYVTRDLDAALARFAEREGIDQFYVMVPPATRGPVSHIAKVAKTFVGSRMIEIIEPNPAVQSIFEGYVPDEIGDLKFHHLGYIAQNDAHWDEIYAKAAAQSWTAAYEGFAPGLVRSVFFDTRRQLGHFSEYIQNFEGGEELLRNIPRN